MEANGDSDSDHEYYIYSSGDDSEDKARIVDQDSDGDYNIVEGIASGVDHDDRMVTSHEGSEVEDEEHNEDISPHEAFEQVFNTEKEFHDWYADVGLKFGFGVRCCDIVRGKDGSIRRRVMVCCKQGFRQRKHLDREDRSKEAQRLTRCGCKAKCVANLDKNTGKWRITIYDQVHNHPMAHEEEGHLHRSSRKVDKEDLKSAMSMRASNIRMAQAFDLIVNNRGGYKYVGFLRKDLYNAINAALNKIHGDGQSLLDFMHDKVSEDPGHKCMFGLDEEGRLGHVFWRDSLCLEDYERFNDVLVFDATYKTNLYGRPLVLLVGCNHHRMSVLFGCALLMDEKAETYVWLLKVFLKLMNGIHPRVVMTDGDEAMYKAIKEVMPQAKHRLCTWHVARNMKVKITNHNMQQLFMQCMHKRMEIAEFEATWRIMVRGIEADGAGDSVLEWLDNMYSKKDRWAEAFFSGHFFAMMTTTQRVEGLNRHLKRGLSRVSKIYEVPYRIASCLTRMREAILVEDFKTFNSTPLIRSNLPIGERKLANKLTDHIYKLAKKQIARIGKYNVVEFFRNQRTGILYWILDEAYFPERQWHVQFVDDTFVCNCGLFESDGILCAHIYTCMKNNHIKELPDSLIHPRWSIASRDTHRAVDRHQFGSDSAKTNVRHRELQKLANDIVSNSANNGEAYRIALKALTELKISVEKYRKSERVIETERSYLESNDNVIFDPETQKSRKARLADESIGNEEKSKRVRAPIRCSNCGQVGHNRTSCPNTTKNAGGGPSYSAGTQSGENGDASQA